MIELSTFGDVSVRDEAGEDVTALLSQPKRLALLVYLAVAAPKGYVRRDTVLGIFWPDSDMERGRGALRQATRYLRRALGGEVIQSRTADELGVAVDRIRCDAVAFSRYLDSDDPERALDLYRGEFLAGMFVSGAPEFESWVETVRSDLRKAAVDAAWALAHDAERDELFMDAKTWAEWATARSPADELGIRRRIALLDRLGDRAAAVELFERFSEGIRAEYGVQPAPETLALIAGVREREVPRLVTPQDAPRSPRGGTGPPVAEEPGRSPTTLDPKRVLVAILENRTGDPRHDAVGSMAADWIAQGLMDAGVFEVVPLTGAMASARHAHEPSDARETEDTATMLARETGAGTVVMGSYYVHGDDLHFHVQIVDAKRTIILHAPDPIEVPESRALAGIQELREQIVTALAPRHEPHAKHVRAAQRPPTYAAYREYVSGLEPFIRGEWTTALAHFDRCEQIEPTYWLPRIVAAIAQWNLGQLERAEATVRQIELASPTLGPFEREVLRTVRAWLRGDWGTALAAAKCQAELTPGSIPHFQVAEEARRLNRLHEAKDVLAGIDPTRGEMRGFLFYWVEASNIHHMLGMHAQELQMARRARRFHPDSPEVIALELRALAALGRIGDVQRVLNEILTMPSFDDLLWPRLARQAGLELRVHGHPDEAQHTLERGLGRLLSQRPAGTPRSSFRRELALTHYHCGQLDHAHDLFSSLTADERDYGTHHSHLHPHLDAGHLLVIAIQRNETRAAERIAGELAEMNARYTFGRNSYWLAASAAVQGDRVRAVELLRTAFSQGLPHQVSLHLDPHIGRLEGFAPYDELMRPKG